MKILKRLMLVFIWVASVALSIIAYAVAAAITFPMVLPIWIITGANILDSEKTTILDNPFFLVDAIFKRVKL